MPRDQLAKLLIFGYTDAEARFLYLVATHSGYFTVRQFLDFAQAKSGKRNARLVEKLFSLLRITCLWSPSLTLIPTTETLMRISHTCAIIGPYFDSLRAFNSSTFPLQRACRKRQL